MRKREQLERVILEALAKDDCGATEDDLIQLLGARDPSKDASAPPTREEKERVRQTMRNLVRLGLIEPRPDH
jgi:hypothetical protein